MKITCPHCLLLVELEITPKIPKVKRYIIKGIWSGYRSEQSRVCHLVIISAAYKKSIEAYKKLTAVRFTDGTSMSVTIWPLLSGEKVTEIHGYDQLLDKIIRQGLTGSVSVEDVK